MVSTHLYPTRVTVVAGDAVVAEHERLTDKGKTRYDWQHYIPLVQKKPGALRAYSGERDRRFRLIVTGRHAC